MKKLVVLITTYKRPELLKQLLKQIKKQSKGFNITIHILIDQLDGYEDINKFLEDIKIKNIVVRHEHYGKAGYWKVIDAAYCAIRTAKFDYVIQVQVGS